MESKRRLNILLDTFDGKLELTISPKTKGRELFDKVVHALEIKEDCLLGIVGNKADGTELWLDDDKEVMQQRFRKSDPTFFQLRFKYYPCNINSVVTSEPGLKLLYLQVRDAILNGRIFCPKATAVELASYAAQVKFGNLETMATDADYLKKDRWVPTSVLKDPRDRTTARQIRLLIAGLHKNHYGKSIGYSMRRYLEIAQSLSMYGLVHFEATIRRADSKSKCIVGISPYDVRIFEDCNLRLPVSAYGWKDIISCAQMGNQVRIKLRACLTEPDFEITSKAADHIFDYCVTYQRLFNKDQQHDKDMVAAVGFPVSSPEEGRLEKELAKETEAKGRAEQECERLRERQAAILDRLKETEKENEVLKQKLAFTQEKIHLWRTQLLCPPTPCESSAASDVEGDQTIHQSDDSSGARKPPSSLLTCSSRSRLPRPKVSF